MDDDLTVKNSVLQPVHCIAFIGDLRSGLDTGLLKEGRYTFRWVIVGVKGAEELGKCGSAESMGMCG